MVEGYKIWIAANMRATWATAAKRLIPACNNMFWPCLRLDRMAATANIRTTGEKKGPMDQAPMMTKAKRIPTAAQVNAIRTENRPELLPKTPNRPRILTIFISTRYRPGKGHMGCVPLTTCPIHAEIKRHAAAPTTARNCSGK